MGWLFAVALGVQQGERRAVWRAYRRGIRYGTSMLMWGVVSRLHGRYTAGWYSLPAITLASHLVVLLALIAESNRLYARLAISTSAWQRERETRDPLLAPLQAR